MRLHNALFRKLNDHVVFLSPPPFTGSNLAAPYAAAVARDVLRDAYVRRQKRRTVSKRKELLRKVEKVRE